jgi:hypothetical protein
MKLRTLNPIRVVKLISFLTIFLVFFTSCDPGVDYSRVIQNNSEFEVKVISQTKSPWYLDGIDTVYNLPDTILIHKNASTAIFSESSIGGVFQYQNCDFPYEPIPALVYFTDSIKKIPNILNVDGWNFRINKEGRNGGGICECRLILTNDILAE